MNTENSQKLNTVLLVSDRTVLDGQIRDAIFAFERTTGVVATLKGESNSKSGELAQALKDGTAHTTMSKQALDSETVRDGLREILLEPGELCEALRNKAEV